MTHLALAPPPPIHAEGLAPSLLTYAEVQTLLRVSRHTVWRMATQRGELDQQKVASRALITRESVERLLGRPVSIDEIQS